MDRCINGSSASFGMRVGHFRLPPNKRKSPARSIYFAMGHEETSAHLLDHLVGALLKLPGHVEGERLGGLHVDHQLELDGRLDRKFA